MIKSTILSKTIAAAASLAVFASAAHAATLANPASGGAGELFIGVHATGGQGNGQSVVIDAGAVSALSALSTGSTLSLGNLGTDLVATFGSTWYNRADLLWSAVAGVQSTVPTTSSDPTSTLYGGVASDGTFPLPTTSYGRGTNSTQNSVAQRIISNMAAGIGGFTSAATGASSTIGIETASDANAYAKWMPGGSLVSGLGDVPFGGFSGQAFEQAFGPGQVSAGIEGALDVYRMYRSNASDPDASPATGTGPGSYQFTLEINQSGAISANVLPLAAVPEPASIGALTSIALIGVGALRRKRHARV